MKRNGKHAGGFTLLELLIYVSIFAGIMTLFLTSIVTTSRVQIRESADSELTQQLTFTMQTIQRLIQESSTIVVNNAIVTNDCINYELDDPPGTPSACLILRMPDETRDPTIIWKKDNKVKVKIGADVERDLTTEKLAEPGNPNILTFTKFSNPPGHDTVQIDLTLFFDDQGNEDANISRSVKSLISRASAATFDDALLPNANDTHNVGASGQAWKQVFVNNGSDVAPSISFGGQGGIYFDPAAGNEKIKFTIGGDVFEIRADGTINVAGTLQAGSFEAGNGAVGTPAYSFQSEPGLGLYRPLAGEMRFAVGGSDGYSFTNSRIAALSGGSFDAGFGTALDPGFSFGTENVGMFRPLLGEIGFATAGTERMRIDATGNIIIQGPALQLQIGDAINPSLTFAGDPDTGIYSSGLDTINFSTGGSEAMSLMLDNDVEVKGQLEAADGSAAEPAYAFESATNIGMYREGNNLKFSVGGEKFFIDGTNDRLESAPGLNLRMRIGDGSAAQPAYSFTSDIGTGLYHASEGQYIFVSNGVNTAGISQGDSGAKYFSILTKGSAAPDSLDCNQGFEAGRMYLRTGSPNEALYVCQGNDGWMKADLTP
jgi:type II secretory pathway pseudopilin PulG